MFAYPHLQSVFLTARYKLKSSNQFFNSWFHGKITRDQAEHVMTSASDGQFLIKESVNFPGDYVLFVW